MYTLKTAGAAVAYCVTDCCQNTISAGTSSVAGVNINLGPATMLTFWFQQGTTSPIYRIEDVLSILPLLVGGYVIFSITYSLLRLCRGEIKLRFRAVK
jgi:hypothetical protein